MRFAPDIDDAPTLEIPDLRAKAQKVLHLMIGADITAEEYLERLDIIQSALREVYQEAVAVTSAREAYRVSQLERDMRKSTRRPKETNPGIGPAVTIPPPPKLPREG